MSKLQSFFTRAVAVTPDDTEYIQNPSYLPAAIEMAGAIITVEGNKVTSVVLAKAGIGYSSLGNIAFSITGGSGSGATLAPNLVGGGVQVIVTNGGSGYDNGRYVNGDKYTVGLTGTGTLSNNVSPAQGAIIQANSFSAPNERIRVITVGGDALEFPLGAVGVTVQIPVQVIQVTSTGTTCTGDIIAMW